MSDWAVDVYVCSHVSGIHQNVALYGRGMLFLGLLAIKDFFDD